MLIESHLEALATRAILDQTGQVSPALLKATSDARHGDYQVNAAMALGKKLGRPPREIATEIASQLEQADEIASAEVAGPGFINLKLENAWLATCLSDAVKDHKRDGVDSVAEPKKVVVDFSSPNIAKQMHVGHLRSTIIGDSLSKILRFVGHQVIGDNHIGDWGTQYGLLLVGMREFGDAQALNDSPIVELERIYKAASAKAKEDEDFAQAARLELAKLQNGDAENLRLWKQFVETTRVELDKIYERMEIHFDEWLGESFFNPMLKGVVDELVEKKIARLDDGAQAIFWGEIDQAPPKLKKQKEPFLVQKKDGAFLYSTTDIAALKFRHHEWKADASLYVVDARQAGHFKQLFAVAELLEIPMELAHISFGTVLDEHGKPLKTRDGKAVTLASLLDEAEKRARLRLDEGIAEGRLRVEPEKLDEVARKVGIGAVKYADLRQNRASDYQFDWDKLVSFQGNAGPYLQYAFARISSIFDKADTTIDQAEAQIELDAPEAERLARVLVRFSQVLHQASQNYLPHLLTDHLFELAKAFMSFYEACPVLKAEGNVKDSRLALSALTARQMRRGLGLLGIATVDKM